MLWFQPITALENNSINFIKIVRNHLLCMFGKDITWTKRMLQDNLILLVSYENCSVKWLIGTKTLTWLLCSVYFEISKVKNNKFWSVMRLNKYVFKRKTTKQQWNSWSLLCCNNVERMATSFWNIYREQLQIKHYNNAYYQISLLSN